MWDLAAANTACKCQAKAEERMKSLGVRADRHADQGGGSRC